MNARALRAIVGLSLVLFLGQNAAAQQITRFAVVDLNRIITTYSKDSGALKDFELKKSQIQTEIDKLADEIRRLQAQKIEADRAGDKTSSVRLEGEATKKTEFLKEYVRTKQAELDAEAKQLGASSRFIQDVYRQIQTIAESEGYSLVLNLKSADSVMSSVIWYSPMIDITDQVIQGLLGKAP